MEDELDMEVELERELAAEQEELLEEEQQEQEELQRVLELAFAQQQPRPLSRGRSLPANFTFTSLDSPTATGYYIVI